jgi:hypothetical protein
MCLVVGHSDHVIQHQQSAIKAARGGDSNSIISKLTEALSDLEQLKIEMKAATDASVDAANKCQADKVTLTVLHNYIFHLLHDKFFNANCTVTA